MRLCVGVWSHHAHRFYARLRLRCTDYLCCVWFTFGYFDFGFRLPRCVAVWLHTHARLRTVDWFTRCCTRLHVYVYAVGCARTFGCPHARAFVRCAFTVSCLLILRLRFTRITHTRLRFYVWLPRLFAYVYLAPFTFTFTFTRLRFAARSLRCRWTLRVCGRLHVYIYVGYATFTRTRSVYVCQLVGLPVVYATLFCCTQLRLVGFTFCSRCSRLVTHVCYICCLRWLIGYVGLRLRFTHTLLVVYHPTFVTFTLVGWLPFDWLRCVAFVTAFTRLRLRAHAFVPVTRVDCPTFTFTPRLRLRTRSYVILRARVYVYVYSWIYTGLRYVYARLRLRLHTHVGSFTLLLPVCTRLHV